MNNFIPWGSQPLNEWAQKYARGKFIDLDGHKTHYIEKGEGDPVILIHGFFFDTHMWDSNIDALAQGYKVYALDLWGSGYSTRTLMDYGYPLYANQVRSFMDALGVEKATLIGQSMGGGTIIKFGVTNRDRIHKIVLVDPAILHQEVPLIGKVALLPGVGEFLYGLNSNFMREFTLKNTFINDHNIITDEYFHRVTRFQKVEGSTECLLAVLRKQFFFTLDAELHQLATMDVPTLIVAGRQSNGVLPSNSQEVSRILPGSQLEIFEQAGHCPNIDQAEKFNQVTLEFLKR